MSHFSYQVFATVVSQKTFYQAARLLRVTPSAVSHSINQLEQELGFPLFRRNRGGVELTHDGRQILPYVQEILNIERTLQQQADNIRGLNAGLVRIGAFSSVCINWLPEMMQRFKRSYPKVEVTVSQGDFNEIAQAARIGSIDIGFTAMPVMEKLQVYPLVNDPIYCVTSQDFIPKHHSYITNADIAGKKFILQQIDYDRDTKKVLDHYQVAHHSLNFSIDDQSIISMVESQLGMGILPELALQKLTGDINVYPFETPYERHIALVGNKTQMAAPATKEMLLTIKEYLNERYGERCLWQ